MDFFTWLSSFERIKRQPQEGSWVGGKFQVESDFSLTEAEKNNLLDFFGNHANSPFVYFTLQREEKANQQSVYSYDTKFVLVEGVEKAQLWANVNTLTTYEVPVQDDPTQIDYNLPQVGTMYLAFEFVGDDGYVKITCPDGSYVRVYVKDNTLVGEGRQENKSSVVLIENVSVWDSPNFVAGSVLPFGLSWTTNKLYLAHKGKVKQFDFGFSLQDSEVDCLQNTYDVIIFDAPLKELLKFFHLPLEKFTTVNATDYIVSVQDFPFWVAGRIGFEAKFTQSTLSLYKDQSGNYVANRVHFEEV